MSARHRALTALVVAGILAGCTIPASDRTVAIDDGDVPYGLLDPDAAAVADEPEGPAVELCLLRDELVVPVARVVEPSAGLLDIARSLAELTEDERDSRLRTSIVAGDDILEVERAAGVATVLLAPEASARLTADPLATVAQLVCTLTRQPGVGLVRFTVDGVPAEVPRADGSLSQGPVSADDYTSLLSPPG